ncbi:undecaprenyl-phosphate glucose phosphotransferase [Gayadomonas joobiniege]|uniref:undecaprenyl-phosphate glucose phosphotransferase n=1 Tax=Gayadomonas joobiniege TaxID=1234606 RepID=UPI0003685307|nr:undecaprenyl-phosphate glucose phosphotransferase [Gayadomonas joobiniege]
MGKRGYLREHQHAFSSLYRVIDVVLICLTLFVSWDCFAGLDTKQHYFVAIVASLIFLYLAETFGLYRSWRLARFYQLARTITFVWSVTFLSTVFVAVLLEIPEGVSQLVFVSWGLVGTFLLSAWRYAYYVAIKKLRKKGFNTRSVAIIGHTRVGKELYKQIRLHSEAGLKFVGFYEDRMPQRYMGDKYSSDFIRGSAEDAIKAAQRGEIDQIYIALSLKQEDRISQLLVELGDTTADVHFIPDFFVFNLVQSRMGYVGNLTTLSVFESPYAGTNSWLKRAEDIIFSSIILFIISPVLLAIAIGVKVTSPGPVIFKQYRYGLDGKRIKVWKFRSMTTMDNGDKVVQAKKGDARITPFGGFLRRTSLDELPQFINVLQGRMSIVGPRPHAVAHNEEYRKKINYYMMRHKVKPGITGWAQINGWRGETDTLEKMEKRIEYDLHYIGNWSVWFDIKIIFYTVFKGFLDKNAY